jgi:hypothetical protein
MTTPTPVPGPSQDRPGQDVADVLRWLEDLHDRPLPDHVQVFDEVHRALQAALARLDEA